MVFTICRRKRYDFYLKKQRIVLLLLNLLQFTIAGTCLLKETEVWFTMVIALLVSVGVDMRASKDILVSCLHPLCAGVWGTGRRLINSLMSSAVGFSLFLSLA
jgi:hypothetical protein